MDTLPSFCIAFVCTGNICRSAMAEMMMKHECTKRGRTDISVESFGTSDEEVGNPIDPRARAELTAHRIPVTEHTPRQLRAEHVAHADLVIAMTARHYQRILRLAGESATPVRLLHQFDTGADWQRAPDASVPDVADPWYGTAEDFTHTYEELQHALPGIFAAVDHMRHSLR